MELNKTNLKWSEIFPMNKKRRKMGVAVLVGHLVVAGGWNGKVRLAPPEYFNDSLNKWQMDFTSNNEDLKTHRLNRMLIIS